MPLLILIPFAAFAGCMLGQFYLMRQVRRALAGRHPDVWRAISEKAFFIDNAVFSFVWKKRDQALSDPDLSRITRRMRRLQVVAIAIWLLYAAMIVTGVGFQKA